MASNITAPVIKQKRKATENEPICLKVKAMVIAEWPKRSCSERVVTIVNKNMSLDDPVKVLHKVKEGNIRIELGSNKCVSGICWLHLYFSYHLPMHLIR